MTVILGVTVVLLVAAGALAVWRMVVGPSAMDRIISSDVVVAVVIAAVCTYSVIAGNATGLPILLALSLLGFTAAVAVARLITSGQGTQELFDRRRAAREEDVDG